MTIENKTGGSPDDFASEIGLDFRNGYLLYRALTHRSYLNENPDVLEDNERLEFLGDAVLDYLVAEWLFNRFPEMAEGELTRMRSLLVDTQQLAAFATQINLGAFLRLGKGEEDGGGRQRAKVLCGAFEALVGALSIDSDIESVSKFIHPLLEDAVERIIAGEHYKDPKSRLQEWSQSEGNGVPQYNLVSAQGPDHDKTFEMAVVVAGAVLGKGFGSSKQKASIAAARDALTQLGI